MFLYVLKWLFIQKLGPRKNKILGFSGNFMYSYGRMIWQNMSSPSLVQILLPSPEQCWQTPPKKAVRWAPPTATRRPIKVKVPGTPLRPLRGYVLKATPQCQAWCIHCTHHRVCALPHCTGQTLLPPIFTG